MTTVNTTRGVPAAAAGTITLGTRAEELRAERRHSAFSHVATKVFFTSRRPVAADGSSDTATGCLTTLVYVALTV